MAGAAASPWNSPHGSVLAFDLEDDTESSRLLNPAVKNKRQVLVATSAHRKRIILLVSAVTCILVTVCLLFLLIVALQKSRARDDGYVCPALASATNYQATFFVLGDWGRAANLSQRAVAMMMGSLGRCYKPSFVVSTGDNFYNNGLKAVDDPYFTQTFTNVYNASSLQVPWYAVPGNHDYGELDQNLLLTCSAPSLDKCPKGCCYSVLWQAQMGERDSRWRFQQGAWKVSYLNGQVDIIYIDTTPLISHYRKKAWAETPGGIATQNATEQKAAIESLLSSSTARWKLVVGHHPVRSYGEHCADGPLSAGGDCVDMQFMSELMNRYKVSAYFCGHEHDLQLIKHRQAPNADPIHYIVSGAGSDVRSGEFNTTTVLPTDDVFLADRQGFVAVALHSDGSAMDLHFWTATDVVKPAYVVTIPERVD